MFLVTILNELKIAVNPFIFATMCDNNVFLASPDALEVIVVSYSLTYSLSVSTDLTDVTLVSDDTN